MKRWLMLGALALLGGCAAQFNTFDFVVADGRHVISAVNATGEVSNAGHLTVGDDQWGLMMDLQGLSPGSHTISPEVGEAVIWDKTTGNTYVASLGGICAVWVDPHGTANGSPVAGNFSCTGLRSAAGKQLDITSGDFEVPVNDPDNNPTLK